MIKFAKTKPIQRKVLSMIHSIQQFCGEGVVKLDKVFIQYSSDLKKIAEMVQGVTDEVNALGRSMIAEEWESYDKQLCQRKDLRRDWHIVRKDEACVLTSLGTVPYHKTLFKNKHTVSMPTCLTGSWDLESMSG